MGYQKSGSYILGIGCHQWQRTQGDITFKLHTLIHVFHKSLSQFKTLSPSSITSSVAAYQHLGVQFVLRWQTSVWWSDVVNKKTNIQFSILLLFVDILIMCQEVLKKMRARWKYVWGSLKETSWCIDHPNLQQTLRHTTPCCASAFLTAFYTTWLFLSVICLV